MGEVNSSDCSWKKMVIAKANNKWISTIKTEDIEVDPLVHMESETDMNSDHSGPFDNVKKEVEETSADQYYDTDEPTSLTQELDPQSLLEPAERCKRRRGSGPKCESPNERASRLAKMSAYAAQRLANETPEQRATRLRRMSEYAAKRLSSETSEQRAKRLSRMSAYAAKRLANESPEQRHARLTRMSAYAARRQAMKKVSSPSTSVDSENSNFNLSNIMPNQS